MNLDWKEILGGVAPVIAGSLGGPFAGAATKFLAGKLLGKEDADPSELESAILGASPDQLAQIREIDNDFKGKMAELGFKTEELHVRDRGSARDLAKIDMRPQVILSTLYTVGYVVVLWSFMTGQVDIAASVKAEFNMVLGAMTAAQIQILNFWFGSSHGSKSKTKLHTP